MRSSRAILLVLFLLTGVFTLGTALQTRMLHWSGRSASDSVLKILLGDSRRIFANHFFVQADVSFHSGFYPSIFDQARAAEEKDSDVSHPGENEKEQLETSFLGKPTDWIDSFGRHFRPTIHTHLKGANVREMLPWLRISADLDPHRIETYIVTAYWLGRRMGKVDEAEQFLWEGLRANPNDPQLLNELGRLYYEERKDSTRARNVWLVALRQWQIKEKPTAKPNYLVLERILSGLTSVDVQQGRVQEALQYLDQLKQISPEPAQVQERIDELKAGIHKSLKW
jgi:tetratricopeptide (TPR) repeat protein